MEKALSEAHLWQLEDGSFRAGSILSAWRVMARLGQPYRFSGQGPRGYECQVYDIQSGSCIGLGQGGSCAEAMCLAALQARRSSGSGDPAQQHQVETEGVQPGVE